jgi:hypothetical protein
LGICRIAGLLLGLLGNGGGDGSSVLARGGTQ